MKQAEFQTVSDYIGRLEPEMIALQKELVRRPAISPKSGGTGEKERVDYLRPLLQSWGLEVTEYRAPDPDAPCGYRPSLVARWKPSSDQNRKPALWIMTHLDVVPAGPAELWTHPPFEATVEDGKLYGRGTEDNQQELVASCFALKALLDLGLRPAREVCLMLVADEETGSALGADWLLSQYDLCRPDDLVVVPDAGNEEGTMIEIAEKSILWLKFTVQGRQSHASAPQANAHRAGAHLLVRLDKELHEKYPLRDELFAPPLSTFEPTKREANVPNINTIPAQDVFYFDCRILPQYRLEDILADVRRLAEETAREFGLQITVQTEQLAPAAPPTSPDAPVVGLLSRAIEAVYHKKPVLKGIGGGTVAAFFRRRGIPAVVWGKYRGKAHAPDEYCVIADMVDDARVHAYMMLDSA